ncbi:MAG: hypothetical protein IKW74_05845, partial [Thermoguttaceae bacterium]|nr:hypothetical protein [Thermoguttaceae bacterium]
ETQTPRENELKEEIAETLQKAALLKQEIADLEQKKDTGGKSYAIIPYQGTSGTFRRPIFIECTETGVFLMPEGIEFTWEDFLLDRYPGNPFDTAIRSVSQYMKETDPNAKINPEGYEPYPLLIVRPGGTEKYYRVVAALASWGGVYGYELVDESDEIEYPPRNNELYNRVTDQVSLARYKLQVPLASLLAEMRQKQEQTDWLAVQSVSENENRQGGESLLQSKLGQNVRLAGNVASDKRQGFSGETVAGYASGQPDQRSGTGLATNNPRGTGSGFASAGNFALTPEDGGGEMMSETRLPQYKGQYAENLGTGIRQPVLSEQSGRWETGGSGVPGFTTFGSMGHGMTGSSNGISNGKNQSGSPGSSPQGIQENLTSGNSDGPDYSGGDTAGSMTGGTLASSSSQLLNQSRNIQSPEAGTVTGESPPLKNRWETVGNTVYKQNGDGTSAEGTTRQTSQNSPKEKTGEQKNVNPLPENAILLSQELRKPASAASERPVSVRIYADRVVFPAQPGLKNEQTIPMTDDFSGAFDQMVDAVAACVRGWGVAGRNMYWMPWIKATVEENAEPQFEQFYRFFVDQGISVRR